MFPRNYLSGGKLLNFHKRRRARPNQAAVLANCNVIRVGEIQL